ncbi:type I restriction enzyme, S subunit [Saccharicrinis carchari]|uniref:Type I restriction enzyme, S subunit n=1 Tax=Saccharicrinis carchari TaxID=1168039 RepID=A0A521AY75_SACCC|nr:restriction endonuclease subunit S [Saccharicrinis carchari]SMO39711.1 type I restriction enzyme, S subunit [Saccharicrinis carchari]
MKLKIDKNNWEKVKLIDVFTKREENDKVNAKKRFDKFLKVEHMDKESLHIKRWSSQEKGDELNPYFYKIFRKGQILFPTRNPHLRRTALASFDGICGEKTLTLEPNEEFIIPEFIPFLFHSESFYAHTTGVIIGSTNPHCRWRDVANYEFLLPPKDQQNQLAELLWAMDDVIKKEREVLERLNEASQIAFENEIEKSSGELIPLSEVLIPKKAKSQVPHKINRYIGLEHIESGAFSCIEFGNSNEVLAQCNIVEEGDLCYSKLRPYLDKAFIATFQAVSTTELLIYNTHKLSKEFVLYHLHSKPFIHFVTGKGFGTKMPRVSHKIIGEYKVKLVDDEDKILGLMRNFEKSKTNMNTKIINSKALQKSLINQIF